MQFRDAHIVHAFFHEALGLHWSDDFRGVLYVPEVYLGSQAAPDHVAIGVAYNSFVGKVCCIHSVVRRPQSVTRAILRATFEFPFEHCHCDAVLALVDSTNDAAMNFDTKLGFKQIACVPRGGVDGDLNVLQMLKSECRWLKANVH
jgi:RimJ/RimL family protein N-acetyltransferase